MEALIKVIVIQYKGSQISTKVLNMSMNLSSIVDFVGEDIGPGAVYAMAG